MLFFARENCLITNEETISGYFGEKNVPIFIRKKSSEELHLRKLLLPNFGHGNIKFRTITDKKKSLSSRKEIIDIHSLWFGHVMPIFLTRCSPVESHYNEY